MKSSTVRLAVVMMLTGLLCVPAVMAQTPEYSTITFTEPTDVGGTILQPGDYLIRVLPGYPNRNRVQITNMDRTEIYTTLLTVPHQAGPNELIPNTRLVFYPSIAGEPRALRTWFAPDPVGNEGHDIVYEEDRALRLARAASAPVVSFQEPIDVTVVDTEPELIVVSPDERVVPYVAVIDTDTDTDLDVDLDIDDEPTRVAEVRTQLPRTSSRMPLFGLLGLLAMTGAVAFRFMNR